MERILAAQKFPEQFALPLAQYIELGEQVDGRLRDKFVLQMVQFPQACHWWVSQGIKLTTHKRSFVTVNFFYVHPGLIRTYQDRYFEVMKTQATSVTQLARLGESFLSLLSEEDKQRVLPQFRLVIKKLVPALPPVNPQIFDPQGRYQDPNFPEDKDQVYNLIWEAVLGNSHD